MLAVILAGGLGTRLQPFTLTVPKPLLPLGDTPIIEVVLQQLHRYGFTRVVICLGYKAEMLREVLGDGARFDLAIDYVKEDSPLGTAGALFLLDTTPSYFLVMNGDLLTTIDYSSFLHAAELRGASAAVLLTERIINLDYGVLEVDNNEILQGYKEKPKLSFKVSTGIYAFSRSVFQHLDGSRLDMPELFTSLMNNGTPIYAPTTDEYWQDIGRPTDYETAQIDFMKNRSKFLE